MATISSPYAADAAELSLIPGDVDYAGWHPATRVAFRFCFLYFGLYIITTQMLAAFIPIPGLNLPDLGVLPPLRQLFLWIGNHLLGLAPPTSPPKTGTGDTLFGWIQAFSLLLIATIGTAIWSVVARRRRDHRKLYGWFRLVLRIAVGTAFLVYGFAKVIPSQMPILDLARLVEPFGNFSPMSVLWSSIGASPVYEVATGCAEVVGGMLLFFPATSLVGTLICLMDAAMVFLLNMTYNVDVKLFSFHLVVMSLFLLAPNARPLFDLFIRHRVGSLRAEPAVGGSPSAWRKLVIAQAVFAVYILAVVAVSAVHDWNTYGGGAPRSPLFGIWNVDSMTVGGVTKVPMVSDSTRWRRVIFQSVDAATLQRMDDSFRHYRASIDSTAGSLTLTLLDSLTPSKVDSAAPKSVLTYRRVDLEHLLIDGTLDAQDVHLALTARKLDSFLQRRRRFHWVSEFQFDR
jgi:hypothetical protein